MPPHDTVPLDGEWLFAFSPTPPAGPCTRLADLRAAGLTLRPAAVPGNVELDLQRHGFIADPLVGMNALALRGYERTHFWYGRTFRADARVGRQAVLVCEGVDCYATFYLNGALLGTSDNMLIEHRFALDGRLQGENELLVHLRPIWEEASKGAYPAQVAAMPLHLESLYVRKAPTCSAGTSCRGRSPAGSGGRCGGSTFDERRPVLFDAGRIRFRIQGPRLWWPRGSGAPDLYDATVALFKCGEAIGLPSSKMK